ncbi:hypothetical protein ACFVUH_13130 [Kitasatospora sp. NPDC058032]|uniref:hypothetical protein n=1 Tax=Kitasatospora sp. NPDC058032 TaxID=3346307 RepID=UPI0036D8248E
MICPHCEARLRGRERAGRVCGRCRKPFALEPKFTRGLHDLRVRRTVERLGDGGRVVLTVEQLRWAFHERRPPGPVPRENPPARPNPPRFDHPVVIAVNFVVAAAAMTGVCYLLTLSIGLIVFTLPLAAIGLMVLHGAVTELVRWSRRHGLRSAHEQAERAWQERSKRLKQEQAQWTSPLSNDSAWNADMFRSSVVERWIAVHGALPEGVVEESAVRPAELDGPAALGVLCPDRTVTAFLHANGFPARYRAVLVATPAELPKGLPVIVLHDASPAGCLLAGEARAARPDSPVVDAGLSARTVLAAGARAVQLYEHQLREPLRRQLRRLPALTGAERAWFARGLWSPLAALPPRRVLATAERAADRALRRDVGFLSWPVPEVPQ